MKIRVTDGHNHMEWTIETDFSDDTGTKAVVTQIDLSGTHTVLFESVHEATEWAIEQAYYTVEEMGFKFSL